MMVDAKQIEAVLRRGEQGERRAGWDQPATLWQIRAIGTRGIALVPMPLEVMNPPGEFLQYAAHWMTHDPDGQQCSLLMATGGLGEFAGVAFINEVWINNTPGLVPDGRALADIPGSVEARNVACVDTSARLWMLMRKRGGRLEDYTTILGSDITPHIYGRIPGALRDMVLTIAQHLPEGGADLEALRSMAVTDADIRSAHAEPQ